MYKWVGLLIGVLIVVILCTRLNTEQQLCKAAKFNVAAAEYRYKASRVEFINELYRFERYKVLFNDAVHKDDWQAEVEQLKRENGYYDR